MELLGELFREYGLDALLLIVLGALFIWGIVHWTASPGSEISILWGLVKYTKGKAAPEVSQETSTRTISKPSPPMGSDVDAVAAIRREAERLLKMTKVGPASLWLMAEATTSKLNSLLLLADQLEDEYQAEVLAHLAGIYASGI